MGLSLHTKIYRDIVEMLERCRVERRDIISRCISKAGLTDEELTDNSAGSKQSKLRGDVGRILSEMESRGLIATDSGGLYYLVSSRPVVVRIEQCEKELIKALSESPMTKKEIRERLRAVFGTDKTPSSRDDDVLYTFMGQTLTKLLRIGIVLLADGKYTLSEKASARADDINALLELRSKFISVLHSQGGEFFENYFMTLLSKYSEKHGKKVLECYVNGGASDGGIDGVMKTEDSLGFRELTMVQTKNRIEIVNETDVRGFYGAVCAKKGTRGIFACTSDFHSGATAFLKELDDCIGINGNDVFKMAVECLYGIKKKQGVLSVDERIMH
jgi:restriction endonuclease Mrr